MTTLESSAARLGVELLRRLIGTNRLVAGLLRRGKGKRITVVTQERKL